MLIGLKSSMKMARAAVLIMDRLSGDIQTNRSFVLIDLKDPKNPSAGKIKILAFPIICIRMMTDDYWIGKTRKNFQPLYHN